MKAKLALIKGRITPVTTSLKTRYLVPVMGLGIGAVNAMAQDTGTAGLWTEATSQVTDAKTALVTFLGVMILVPLAFFAYKLVSRAFSGGR